MAGAVKHILVAEDDAVLASVHRFNLERGGFGVTVAHNGLEAWRYAQEQDFDLVVTDHQMPLMTGEDLTRALRNDEKYKDTPIVFVTGKALEANIGELTGEMGVFATLCKPFSPSILLSTVRSALAGEAPLF